MADPRAEVVLRLLRQLDGNKSAVAKRIGLSRRTISRIVDSVDEKARKKAVQASKASLPVSSRIGEMDAATALYEWLRPKMNKTFAQGEACAILNRGLPYLKQVVKELQESGYNIYFDYGQIGLLSDDEPNRVRIVDSSKMETIRFGVVSDTHIGSKAERLDVLHDLYDWYEDDGIGLVYHAGNLIEGERRFNVRERYVHGMDNQIRNLGEKYPRRRGVVTRYIAGDDHEGWYQQDVGVSIGRHIQHVLTDMGRSDLEYLGYVESDIEYHNGNGSFVIRVMHPGGGSAYAISYTPQKIVESLQGGEKPAVLIIGHYHKAEHLPHVRNVDVIQAGCTTDQTVFLRKKKIECHVGGWQVEIEQDKQTGAVKMVRAAFRKYYDRGFGQDWDRH